MEGIVENKKQKISILSMPIILGIVLTVGIQFFIETPFYSYARMALYAIIIASVLLNVSNIKISKNGFQMVFTTTIFLSAICSLLIYLFTSNTLAVKYVIETAFPFVIFLLGYSVKMTDKNKNYFIFTYIILATLLGIFMVMVYGDGFNITQFYFLRSKNQIGPFIASSSLLSLITFFTYKERENIPFKRGTIFLLFGVNMAVLLALRNRSGIVAVSLCFAVYLLSKISIKKNIKIKFSKIILVFSLFFFFAILFALGVFDPVIDYFMQSMFLNYDITDLNSFSADRTDVYIDVLDFLGKSPLFGELATHSGISEVPHNYLLNQWMNFGLVGIFPLWVFYLVLWGYVLKIILGHKVHLYSSYLMLFMLIISIFEYSYPYSPLTTVCLTWFMFGLENRNRLNQTAR